MQAAAQRQEGAACGVARCPGVSDETFQYALQNRDFFERFHPRAVFPMHADAGARMYREFAAAFRARLPGLPVMVPEKLGDRFEYRGGRIGRSGP
jgi:hypothetical protein